MSEQKPHSTRLLRATLEVQGHKWVSLDDYERLEEQFEASEKARKLLIQEADQMGASLDGLREQLEAARRPIRLLEDEWREQLSALNAENAKLNAENRDLLEKWSARGRVVDAARVILTLADEERDDLAGEVSKYLGPWADLVEAVHAESSPAKRPS